MIEWIHYNRMVYRASVTLMYKYLYWLDVKQAKLSIFNLVA